MNEIIDRLIKIAKSYRLENEKLGEEFLYRGNKEKLEKWLEDKKKYSIQEETVYEIIEKLGE